MEKKLHYISLLCKKIFLMDIKKICIPINPVECNMEIMKHYI